MRRPLLVMAAIFLGFFVWKALPFLTADRQDTYATPSLQPDTLAPLQALTVPAGAKVCVDKVPFGPDARYVLVTGLPGTPTTKPLELTAGAPGYRARGRIPAGLADNQQAIVKLEPAAVTESLGTVCIRNAERRTVGFYGTGRDGRMAAPSMTTIDGRPAPVSLSLSLLTTPNASIGSRLGELSGRIAAFRPVTGWQVFLTMVLLLIGTPAALMAAVAYAGRAAGEDPPSTDE